MVSILFSLLLTLQLLCAQPPLLQDAAQPAPELRTQPQAERLFWGMLDPELSAWFARIPREADDPACLKWDWSWRGFWSALFEQPMLKEAAEDARIL